MADKAGVICHSVHTNHYTIYILLVTYYWLHITGYILLVTYYWLHITGYILLVTYYWLQVTAQCVLMVTSHCTMCINGYKSLHNVY